MSCHSALHANLGHTHIIPHPRYDTFNLTSCDYQPLLMNVRSLLFVGMFSLAESLHEELVRRLVILYGAKATGPTSSSHGIAAPLHGVAAQCRGAPFQESGHGV
ncbi:unnamed protein product [Prorocentrum cordatum]|uniref:Uncharacterized protein n=1 Tax=Prorocentrum cordatum TaxID=2364126 RepID=A0ABN9X8Y9_9DINO|nr:unnamed protein product [Polarella glacialis]